MYWLSQALSVRVSLRRRSISSRVKRSGQAQPEQMSMTTPGADGKTTKPASNRKSTPCRSMRAPLWRSEERRVGKGVDLGGRRIIKKKKKKKKKVKDGRKRKKKEKASKIQYQPPN